MLDLKFRDLLQTSLRRQQKIFENQLILNPVENIPGKEFLEPATSFLHGLYNSDKLRDLEQKKQTIVQFAGRDRIGYDINLIYRQWAEHLGAKDLSMRLLSGLHAHIIMFMGLGKHGDKVMLLPPESGGHFATKGILERLGYQVYDIPIDIKNRSIDLPASINMMKVVQPQFLFVDRSEGLNYEDFTELTGATNAYCIFDASQCLSNILAKHFQSPFEMGFDLVVSTIHKNFPGPQRAIVFTKNKDESWQKMKTAMSQYVSNMHSFSIYSAGLIISDFEEICKYSQIMLDNAISLDNGLREQGVSMIERFSGTPTTHHSWLKCKDRNFAFNLYLALEKTGILVNYRLLPYDIGFGLRLGTAAVAYDGFKSQDMKLLSKWMSIIYHRGFSLKIKHEVRQWIQDIRKRNELNS